MPNMMVHVLESSLGTKLLQMLLSSSKFTIFPKYLSKHFSPKLLELGIVCKFFTKRQNFRLVWSKLKAFADNKKNSIENLKIILGRIESLVEKGDNAGYQHFFLFPTMFSKGFLY